VIEWNAGGDS